MNNFINSNDFKIDLQLPLNIPQITDSLDTDFIPKYQKEILISLLGLTLYKEFESGLNEDEIEEKWINLRDGIIYQDYDDNNILQDVEFLGTKEIVKYYVYYKYVSQLQQKISPLGQVIPTSENSQLISAIANLVIIWRKMLEYYGIKSYKQSNLFYSSDFIRYPILNEPINKKLNGSAYNFINRMNELDFTTYENFIFTELSTQYILTY